MNSDPFLYTSPGGWMSVRNAGQYYYSERAGRDSIAVVLTRNGYSEVLTRWQPMIADDSTWHPCPITGCVDRPLSYVEMAQKEIAEETGYILPLPEIFFLTRYMVGTQTNERCFLWTADVTGKNAGPDKNEQMGEAGENRWMPLEEMKNTEYAGTLIAYLFLCDLRDAFLHGR